MKIVYLNQKLWNDIDSLNEEEIAVQRKYFMKFIFVSWNVRIIIFEDVCFCKYNEWYGKDKREDRTAKQTQET